MKTRTIVAENVKRLRLARQWSQDELSDASGVGQTTISSVERHASKAPTLDTLVHLSRALGVEPWTLLREEPTTHPEPGRE